jgi:hypothetical protein
MTDDQTASVPESAVLSGQGADADRLLNASAIEVVRRALGGVGGVTVHTHRFGGVEFRVGRRELGHLHRSFADLPFPRRVRDELIAAGRARPHHVVPDSGWVTVPMRTASEVANVIDLFRENYERAVGQLATSARVSGGG